MTSFPPPSRGAEVRDSDDDGLLGYVLRYPRVYRNWPSVLVHRFLARFPQVGVLHDGRRVKLSDPLQLTRSSRYELRGWHYDAVSDTVSIPWRTGPVLLEGVGRDGDPVGIFDLDDYGMLDVGGRTVIDLGANVGDSVVYFALRGARRVVGLEPFPVPYRAALRNVDRNGVGERVTLLRAACGARDGTVEIEGDRDSTLGTRAVDSSGGLGTPTLSLRTIVDRFDVHDGVLKMDCEGEEYAIVGATPPEVLGRFDQILIEYHCGVPPLDVQLAGAGFRVEVRPRRRPSPIQRLKEAGFEFQVDRFVPRRHPPPSPGTARPARDLPPGATRPRGEYGFVIGRRAGGSRGPAGAPAS